LVNHDGAFARIEAKQWRKEKRVRERSEGKNLGA